MMFWQSFYLLQKSTDFKLFLSFLASSHHDNYRSLNFGFLPWFCCQRAGIRTTDLEGTLSILTYWIDLLFEVKGNRFLNHPVTRTNSVFMICRIYFNSYSLFGVFFVLFLSEMEGGLFFLFIVLLLWTYYQQSTKIKTTHKTCIQSSLQGEYLIPSLCRRGEEKVLKFAKLL